MKIITAASILALGITGAVAQTTTPAPGNAVPRPNTPGEMAPGTMTPNRTAPGTQTPGNAAPGANTGSPTSGTPTGSSNPAVNTTGNAPSSVNATGQAAVVGLTALEAGANSFTENQARTRIEGAGLTGVTGLQKDDQGIWRGRAMRNGQQVTVGFDYKGNIGVQ